MIVSPTESPLLKIERAEKHIKDLESDVRAFHDTKPYSVRVHLNAKPGQHDVFAHVSDSIPTALSLIVGDAAHNLRSALDHLVWELSYRNWLANPKGVTEPNQETQFPIFRHRPGPGDKKSKFWKKVKSIRPDALAIVDRVQPYAVSPNEPESHPLWILNDLDIRDKHKRIDLALALPSAFSVVMIKATGEHVRKAFHLSALNLASDQFLPFEDGAHLVTVENVVGPPSGPFERDHSIVDVKVAVAVEICFGHDLAGKYKPIVSTLKTCLSLVREIANELEPCFKGLAIIHRVPVK